MELVVRLRFTTPALGNVRRDDYDRMMRDSDGNVIFMPSWWRAAFAQAAKALSRSHHYVNQIFAAPPIDGPISKIERRYGKEPSDVKTHEGFDVGAVVTVRFAIPGKMHIRQFIELLEAVGTYIGISPYGWKRASYGHFQILEVKKIGASNNKKSRRSYPSNPAVQGAAGTSPEVPETKADGGECQAG